jgi:hypothetical protein
MNEAVIDRLETQAAEIVSAVKGMLSEMESHLAQSVNDQRVNNVQAREEAVRLQALFKDVSTQLRTLTESARKDFADIRTEWKQPLQDAAKAAGAAQAQAFGEQISAGVKRQLDEVSRDARSALDRYHWTSIAAWAIGVGLAIPLTVALGVWALLPQSDVIDPLRVRLAIVLLEPCEVAGETRVCVPVDDKPQLVRTKNGRELTPVRGL